MSDVAEAVARDRQPTLEAVVGVWERVLQRTPILPDQDFFDLGGDSLLALQLFAELERVTGRNLPITTIYDASTVAKLSALLGDPGEPPAFSPLVLLHDSIGTAAAEPVFLVHGIGGNVMELARLGGVIEPCRRVFAIQARGLDGIETAIESIEEMADYYIDAIRKEQRQGPYLLVGYSFGGIVALEMARRLEASGQSVALLGFIDSYPHPRHWPMVSWLDVRWRRAAHRATRMLSAGAARVAERVKGRRSPRRPRGAEAIARPFLFDEDWPEAVRRVYDTSLTALARYVPSGYAGSVVFFRAESRSFYLPNSPRRMWGGLLGKLDVVTVPGDHVDMVGSNAAALGTAIGEHVNAGLARADLAGADAARADVARADVARAGRPALA